MKYLALRVKNIGDTIDFLQKQAVEVIHSRMETRDQALANLTEGLFDQGLARTIDQHELRWFHVQTELDDQIILAWSVCELCLDEQQFEHHKSTIRHCTGIAYWDATHGLAKQHTIKPQDREISYTNTKHNSLVINRTYAKSVVGIATDKTVLTSPRAKAIAVPKQSITTAAPKKRAVATAPKKTTTHAATKTEPTAVKKTATQAKKTLAQPTTTKRSVKKVTKKVIKKMATNTSTKATEKKSTAKTSNNSTIMAPKKKSKKEPQLDLFG